MTFQTLLLGTYIKIKHAIFQVGKKLNILLPFLSITISKDDKQFIVKYILRYTIINKLRRHP